MSLTPFETAQAHDTPTVIQLSIFIDDSVGQLLRLTQILDKTDIRILGLMVLNSIDCAIVRMIVDDPDEAYRVLTERKFPVKQTELLVVALPHGKRGLLDLWSAVLSAEINIHYTYALLGLSHGSRVIAVHAENTSTAYEAILQRHFTVLDQSQLLSDKYEE